MREYFINLRYIGKYANRPVVKFFCRFALLICSDALAVLKYSRKLPMSTQLL